MLPASIIVTTNITIATAVMATIRAVVTMEGDTTEGITKATVATTAAVNTAAKTVEIEEVIKATIAATIIATTAATVAIVVTTARALTIRIGQGKVTMVTQVVTSEAVVTVDPTVTITIETIIVAEMIIVMEEMTATDRELVLIAVAQMPRVALGMEPTTAAVVAIGADRETTIGWVTKVQRRK